PLPRGSGRDRPAGAKRSGRVKTRVLRAISLKFVLGTEICRCPGAQGIAGALRLSLGKPCRGIGFVPREGRGKPNWAAAPSDLKPKIKLRPGGPDAEIRASFEAPLAAPFPP